jgi:hypothetical protein
MSKQDSRADQLNAHIDDKLLFMARLAARSKRQTIGEFIEDALRAALPLVPMPKGEPNVTEPTGPLHSPWMEKYWIDTGKRDKDAAARLYEVGTARFYEKTPVELLAPRQRAIFNQILAELARQGKKATQKNFVEFFDYSKSGE